MLIGAIGFRFGPPACRRLHPATLWAGLGLVISQPLRLVVSGSSAWMTFARWLAGLAG